MGRGLNVRFSPFFADAPSTSVCSAHARARRLRHFCRWPWALCFVRYGLATPTSAHGGGRGSPCPPAGVAGADEDTRTEIGNVNVCPRRRHKAPQAPCSIRAQNSCKKRTRGAHRPLRGGSGGTGLPGDRSLRSDSCNLNLSARRNPAAHQSAGSPLGCSTDSPGKYIIEKKI